MADKKINISFSVIGEEAAQKLRDVSTGIESVKNNAQKTTPTIKDNNLQLMNMSRIVQDLPFGFMGIGNNITFMAEQMTRAKTEGISFTTQLKGMLSSLTGVGGLMFAISAVTSLITYFSMQSRGAAESTKSLSEELKDLWSEAFKAEVQFDKLAKDLEKFTVAELNESLKIVNEQLKDVGLSFWQSGLYALGFRGVLEDTYKEIYKLVKEKEALDNQLNPKQDRPKGILELLKAERDKYEALRNQATTLSDITKYKKIIFAIDDRINEIDGSRVKKLKEQNEEIEKQITGFNALRNKAMQFNDTADSPFNNFGGDAGNKKAPSTPKGMADIAGMRGVKQNFEIFNSIAHSSANTMRDVFTQAWRDIFGEANSLLEIFLQNIAEGLLNLAAGSVATSIFSFLTGGLGGALGALKPISGDTIVNLKIGDDTIEKFVFKGLPGAMNHATRIRAF